MTRIVQNLTVQLNVEAGPVKKLVDMLGEYREAIAVCRTTKNS